MTEQNGRDLQREKGEATRKKKWEMRQEKKRLLALKQQQEAEKKRREDEAFMREALRQAQKAAALGDVPIGCVIVFRGKIIARGYNRRNADKSVLSHAEIISIKKACKKIGDWRLEDCTMYVTLEPCPMCAGRGGAAGRLHGHAGGVFQGSAVQKGRRYRKSVRK